MCNILLTVSYNHSLISSISLRSDSGYKSTAALSAGSKSSNALLNIRMISALSLFTIVAVFLSQRMGTLKLYR